jgi:tripartite-type tricarboxylate transporter receptor subunit TctC
LGLAHYSYGQAYPTRPIEILVGFNPGATFDLVARILADTVSKYMTQPVVVINKPGASSAIAASDVVASPPNGYKLLFTTNIFFGSTTKSQQIPFDPNILMPLANFLEFKGATLIRGDSPWNNVDDVLAYARKNPRKLKWNHAGRGTSLHIGGLIMFRKAGVETLEVPGYKSSPELLAALLGGHVDVIMGSYGPAKDMIHSGKVKCLMTLSDRRYKDTATIPCSSELGFPEFGMLSTLAGIYLHKETPRDIVKILSDAFRKTSENPEVAKSIEKIGEEPRFGGPEFMKETIKKCEETSVPILKELGLYLGK